MKTIAIVSGIAGLWLLASSLNGLDAENQFNHCLDTHTATGLYITDSQISDVIQGCEDRTGFKSTFNTF